MKHTATGKSSDLPIAGCDQIVYGFPKALSANSVTLRVSTIVPWNRFRFHGIDPHCFIKPLPR